MRAIRPRLASSDEWDASSMPRLLGYGAEGVNQKHATAALAGDLAASAGASDAVECPGSMDAALHA
jgi:hypothetical protein